MEFKKVYLALSDYGSGYEMYCGWDYLFKDIDCCFRLNIVSFDGTEKCCEWSGKFGVIDLEEGTLEVLDY